ncbi:MAG: sigma-70 family RNA polymerase sigma factor [Bryobacteraceae bacterium]
MDVASEDRLIALAKAGDHCAFTELADRTSPAARRLAFSILRDRDSAADAMQDALAKAWEHLPGFHGEAKFSTWFGRIVFNQCLMTLRRKRRARLDSLDQCDPESKRPTFEFGTSAPSPEQALASAEAAQLLRDQINRLPRLLRDPLRLRDLEELPLEVVASRLSLSIPALKSRLQRARQELRHRMQPFAGFRESSPIGRGLAV